MYTKILTAAATAVFLFVSIKEIKKATPLECFIVERKNSNNCECENGKQPPSKAIAAKVLPSLKLSLPSKPEQNSIFNEYSSEIAQVVEICKGNNIFDEECISQTKHFTVAQLAELAGTDEFWIISQKNTLHYYEAYDQFFSNKVSEKNLTVLEIGVRFGNSLRFWQRLFPNAQVVGFDIVTQGNLIYDILSRDLWYLIFGSAFTYFFFLTFHFLPPKNEKGLPLPLFENVSRSDRIYRGSFGPYSPGLRSSLCQGSPRSFSVSLAPIKGPPC
jgi:hypothetical protein